MAHAWHAVLSIKLSSMLHTYNTFAEFTCNIVVISSTHMTLQVYLQVFFFIQHVL